MGLFRPIARSLLGAGGDRPASNNVRSHSPLPVVQALEEARAALASGQLSESLAALERSEDQDVAGIALLRGQVLAAWGRHVEADRHLSGVESVTAADSAALHALAGSADRRDEPELAWRWWSRAIELDPNDVQAILGRARAAYRLGDAASALRDAEEAARRYAGSTEGKLLVAAIHRDARRFDEAERTLREASTSRPEDLGPMRELALLLSSEHRDAEALEWLARARARCDEDAIDDQLLVNTAIGLRYVDREREGLDLLLQGLSRRTLLNGHLELGPALLSFGVFDEGWRQYEHRWFVAPLAAQRADYGIPQWMGQPLKDRAILVRCEQGFGDNFQVARYLPHLKALGATVLLLPLQGLETMARRFAGVDRVLSLGEPLPALDFYVNAMSLPLAFGTTLETIPAEMPYLEADAERLRRWTPRVRRIGKPLVGIIWAGRPTHVLDRLRSISIDQLAPILAVEGVRFVSLQKGTSVTQAESIPDRVDWDSLGPELDDFEDAAAVLANLDLLVCVDTGPAHLAGAMGKDVWMMLPARADYRWLRGRNDSPWYPTLRLFRQAAPGEWDDVVDRVALELRRWVAARAWAECTARPPSPMPPAPAESISMPAMLARALDTRAGFMQYYPNDRLGRALEYYGEWLEGVLEVIRTMLPRGASIVEAGSGIGAHTLAIAKRIGDDGLLLAYEHDARLRDALELNLAAHGCRHVSVMPAELGDDAPQGAPRETLDGLRLSRLDGVLIQHRASATRILAAADDTLWRCRPWIVAVAEQAEELQEARERLREYGYEAFRSRMPLHVPSNFNRRDDDLFDGASMAVLLATPEERGADPGPAGFERWP